MEELVMNVQKLLNDNRLYADVYNDGAFLKVDVSGDWKHEHLRCDWLIKDNFKVLLNGEEVTESDGSDCYASTHIYLIEIM